LNLIGDFGGGALYLAFGVVCGILEAQRSGRGQIVDAAMVDGAASLMTAFFGMMAAGLGSHERGTNILDTGAHFYEVYECADGRWISVAAIEGKFYAELLRRLDIDPATLPPQMDREHWSEAKSRLAALFKTRTRDEWCGVLEGSDACFAPVLTTDEVPHHRHNALRKTYVEIDGIVQPAPAPRFSRTVPDLPIPPQPPSRLEEADAIFADWLEPSEIAELCKRRTLARHHSRSKATAVETVGLGFCFEDLPVGRRFKTIGRTVTEADITNFVNCTGMVEVLFTNLEFLAHESDIKRRLAPAALVYAFAEGLQVQATMQHTGLAFLHMELNVENPVFAGDTIHAECEIIEARRSRSHLDRGLVRTRVRVVKQDGTIALTYTPLRMIRCRDAGGSG
jgi:acyl dehydratase